MPPGDALLAALYDSVVEDSALERALHLLAEQFHCPSASIISFDAAVPQADVLSAVGTFQNPAFQHAYQTEWSAFDPAPLAFSALPFWRGRRHRHDVQPRFSQDLPVLQR